MQPPPLLLTNGSPFVATKKQRTFLRCELRIFNALALPRSTRKLKGPHTFAEFFSGSSNLTLEFGRSPVIKACEPFDLDFGWNVLDDGDFNSALRYLRQHQPTMVWFAPPCSHWSSLRNLGRPPSSRECSDNLEVMSRTFRLLTTVASYGGFYALEQPRTARSWRDSALSSLSELPHCQLAIFEQCAFGLASTSGSLIRKSTQIATNSPVLAQAMQRRCSGDRKHADSLSSDVQARDTAHYPRAMCRTIRLAVERELFYAFAHVSNCSVPENLKKSTTPKAVFQAARFPATSTLAKPDRPSCSLAGSSSVHTCSDAEMPRSNRRTVHFDSRPPEVVLIAVPSDAQLRPINSSSTAAFPTTRDRFDPAPGEDIDPDGVFNDEDRRGWPDFDDFSDWGERDDEWRERHRVLDPPTVVEIDSDEEQPPAFDPEGPQPAWGNRRAPKPPTNAEVDRALALMHRNLGHPGENEFRRMLASAGCSPEAIAGVSRLKCEVCAQRKAPTLARPSGPVLATEFGEALGADIFWGHDASEHRYPVLNLVDLATRYQLCVMVSKLEPGKILKAFNVWLATFGVPKKMTTDGGAEFQGVFAEALTMFGVAHFVSSAESPWQSGITERRGGALKVALGRIIQQEHIVGKKMLRVAISAAVSARNAVPLWNGYSPAQWVLGKQIHLPGSLLQRPGGLPELHSALDCPSMARRLAIAQSAKAAMLEVDNSNRLRRALLRRSRPHRGDYEKGMSVYFWRRRNSGKKARALWRSGWQGPAVVVATQGRSAVWVSYRGQLLKCSPEMLRKATPSESLTFQEIMRETEIARTLLDGPRTPLDIIEDSELPPFIDEDLVESPTDEQQQDLDETGSIPDAEFRMPYGIPNPPHPMPPQQFPPQPEPFVFGEPQRAPETPLPESDDFEIVGGEDVVGEERPESARKRLRVHLASRLAGEINLKKLPAADREAFVSADKAEWQSFLDHEAVRVLTPAEEKKVLATVPADLVLSSRMVRTDKNKSRVSDAGLPLPLKAKSRVVIRGFEDADFQSRTDAPTLSTTAMHLLCMIAAGRGLRLVSADISTAFLNGRSLDRELYTRLPTDLQVPSMAGRVVKVLKGVYGLRQAPRLWYERLSEEIKALGFRQMKLEPTLYVLDDPLNPGVPLAMVGTHVDDLLCCCNDAGFQVLRRLETPFVIKTWDWDSFTYCGRQVHQLKSMEIQITMKDYTVKLETMKLSEKRKALPESPPDRAELKLFRGLLGSLSWLATQGRPDLSFSVSRLQAYGNDGTVQHVLDANSLVRTAKRTEVVLRYPPVDLSKACFVTVTDASFASMREGRSQSGSLILLGDEALSKGETGYFGLVAWKSCRQKRACRSTVGAEMLSLSDGVDTADWVRGLWSEINGSKDPREALSSLLATSGSPTAKTYLTAS